MVHGTEPLAVLDGDFAEEGRTAWGQLFKVDDVEDRLSDENSVTILFRPSAMLLDGHGASSGVIPDLVDLQKRSAVREIGTQDGAAGVDGAEGLGGRTRSLGENRLRQHDVLDGITVGRLAVIQFQLAGDFVAEAVAALRGDLLDGRTIRLETEGAGGETNLAVGI